ncbi:hypothetical protein AMATHDRAFT_144420 [Amanita thiersii Skay4041]|uniref:HCP-like protein n=1 Tax=Amanita thiersii Skay4041 TaxID=703135 RepID=A0A2A9NSP1_9AGAR|nr:hypothetical protein AMATHDRAFT_144420 [Amanita thiersii Skay4041]
MHTPPKDSQFPSSTHKLRHAESPLDTLVRKTSLRRGNPANLTASGDATLQPTPISPLLHSRFGRDSFATASSRDNNSYLDGTRTSIDTQSPYQELEYQYYDDQSVYSSAAPSPAFQDSWDSTAIPNPLQSPHYSKASTGGHEGHVRGGKALITTPSVTHNFSRPGRPAVPASDEEKRRVLERNARRAQKSPASLYSTYSYYNLDNTTPSPVGSDFRTTTPTASSSQRFLHPDQAGSSRQASPVNEAESKRTPQEYLQLGIQCHEANQLKDSAVYFEKSAKENGGCGVGMLMWGLTLRHGWGCEKDEKGGFKWLRRAAESAVEDLENARVGGGMDPNAVKTELVLAIYEVGQCFFQGWGVGKDQKMAVSYYKVAANLGDPDAQSDLAFCLVNGKGCKKDRKEAARWYRAAVAQGQSDIGLGWIYKDKYQ